MDKFPDDFSYENVRTSSLAKMRLHVYNTLMLYDNHLENFDSVAVECPTGLEDQIVKELGERGFEATASDAINYRTNEVIPGYKIIEITLNAPKQPMIVPPLPK